MTPITRFIRPLHPVNFSSNFQSLRVENYVFDLYKTVEVVVYDTLFGSRVNLQRWLVLMSEHVLRSSLMKLVFRLCRELYRESKQHGERLNARPLGMTK